MRLALPYLVFLTAICVLALVPGAVTAADPYELNAIMPLTGPFSFLGKGEQGGLLGVERAVNQRGGIGGRPIKFVFADDQGNPQAAVQLASALIAKKVPFILGPSSLGSCAAIAPLVKDGPVLYCLSPGLHPPAGSWAFSANVASDDTMSVGIRYFNLRGVRRLAMIAATDASGQDLEKGIDEALALPVNRNMVLVDREHFAPGDVIVSAQIARIKAAQPQVLLIQSTGTPLATVLRAVRDAGLEIPIFTTSGNESYAQMKQYAAFLPKDLYFPGLPLLALSAVTDDRVRNEVLLYLRTLQSMDLKPDIMPATGWDPGMITVSALQKYGLTMTADQFKDYLTNLRGFAGVMGRYDFHEVAQRGLGVASVFITRWDVQKDWWVAASRPAGAPL
ncbi:MAG TPA: ABC transporter substrate-binding protein [Candidatus Binatia bacterium]|nr:ABC transporter substrate-binding protein [Candidatus Binatia bacterium]